MTCAFADLLSAAAEDRAVHACLGVVSLCLVEEVGLWHLPAVGDTAAPGPALEVLLSDLADAKAPGPLCGYCFDLDLDADWSLLCQRAGGIDSYAGAFANLVALRANLINVTARLEGGDLAFDALTLAAEAREGAALTSLCDASKSLTPLITALRSEASELEASVRGDLELRNFLLERARRTSSAPSDEMGLVALSGGLANRLAGSSEAQLYARPLAQIYALKINTLGSLVHLHRFAADYLVAHLNRANHVTTVAAPDGPEVLEIAHDLWCPLDEGALATAEGILTAARAITAPPGKHTSA